MARLPSFLHRNWRGIWRFQRKLPAQLRLNNPGLPSLLRKSLATRDHAEAVKLARKLPVMFDELARTYFETEAAYERGIKLLREYRVAANQPSISSELEGSFLLDLDDDDGHLLNSAAELVEHPGHQEALFSKKEPSRPAALHCAARERGQKDTVGNERKTGR